MTQQVQVEDIVVRVFNDTDAVLVEIYEKYKSPFINWATSNFNIGETEAEDVFQDVVVAFYKNVIEQKLKTLSASLKTYLFSIGKNILLNRNRKIKKERTTLTEDFSQLKLEDWDLGLEELKEQEAKEEGLIKAMESLGESCRKLLKLFYFENKSHTEIVELMSYSSTEVSRSMKRKCIMQLQKII